MQILGLNEAVVGSQNYNCTSADIVGLQKMRTEIV